MSRHVALVTAEIFPGTAGGIGRLVAQLAADLGRDGFRISIVFAGEVNALADYRAAVPPNIDVHHVDELFAASGAMDVPLWAFHWIYYYRSYRVAHALARLHRVKQIDLVEFPDYHGLGYVALKERRLLGVLDDVPMVVRLHGTSEATIAHEETRLFSRAFHQLHAMERYCLQHADGWVTPSESLAAWYGAFYDLRPPATFVSVPPFEKLDSAGARPTRTGTLRVLFYGKLQHLKGVDVILDAFAKARTAGANIELSLVGGDTGEGAASYQRTLEKRLPAELRPFVTFVGRVSTTELPRLVAEHDVAVVASRIETFCLAAHELNWLGIPLILSRIAAFADFFEHLTNCFYYDGTSSGLADALTTLANNPAKLDALTSNKDIVAGRIHVGEDYTSMRPEPPKSAAFAQPKVSVIVPYYEMHAYVEDTLRSLFASTYPNREIIVVNDGSPSEASNAKFDELEARYRGDARMIFVRKPNGGLGSARNSGIARSSGEFILPLDSDDLIEPDFIELAVASLTRNAELAAVSVFTSFFGDGQDPKTPIDYVIPYDLGSLLIMLENRAGTAASMFRRRVFDAHRYDESLTSYEDWEMWWRLAENGEKVEVIPRILFRYRRRQQSMVNTVGAQRHLAHLSRIADLHPKLLAEHASALYLSQCAIISELRNENGELRSLLSMARQPVPERANSKLADALKAELAGLEARGYSKAAKSIGLALRLMNRARRFALERR